MLSPEFARDFGVNIAAGLAVFILDILLIAWLLPRILAKRREAEWKPVLKDLIVELEQHQYQSLSTLIDAARAAVRVADASQHLSSFGHAWRSAIQKLAEARYILAASLPIYALALNPQIASQLASYSRRTVHLLALMDHMVAFCEANNKAVYSDSKKDFDAIEKMLMAKFEIIESVGAGLISKEPDRVHLSLAIAVLRDLSEALGQSVIEAHKNMPKQSLMAT